jgi:hypothetical protein
MVRARRNQAVKEEKRVSEHHQTPEQGETPLTERIKQALTETRVVLPGIQALLGFQFAVVVASGFEKLPQELKQIHLASLGLIAISTVLLMSPAAYHRIVDDGEDTEQMHRFTSQMILAAMFFLALGIAGDFYVVVDKVIGSGPLALGSALVVVLLFWGLWFGLMLILRTRRGSSRRPAETRLDQ